MDTTLGGLCTAPASDPPVTDDFDRNCNRLPPMIETAKNRWSVDPLGNDRCRGRIHASFEVRW